MSKKGKGSKSWRAPYKHPIKGVEKSSRLSWLKWAFAIVLIVGIVTSYYIEKVGEGKVPVKLGSNGYPKSLSDTHFSRARALVSRSIRHGYGFRSSHNIFVVPHFFTDEEINDIIEICDRKAEASAHLSKSFFYNRNKYTSYAQYIARVEVEIYETRRDLFDRIVETSWVMDELKWNKFGKKAKSAKPQIEYIDYDVKRLGKAGSFSQHVDNYSTVTVICMLTPTNEYTGGSNYFFVNDTYCEYDPSLDNTADYVEIKLQKGECLFMRGEVVKHGVNDVHSGRRVVLQAEMNEVKLPKDDIFNMGWDGEVPGVDCKPNP